MSQRIAPRRLYLTADKAAVVGEGDPRAAFLLAGKGAPIPDDIDVPAELLEPEQAEATDDDEPAEKPEGEATAKRGGRRRSPDAAEASSDTED